ncbi:ATPase, P-type (transporting), HAD superfamily, subfamily IC/heavy metal translocating P-type ATPase [Granulicatella balaenopterae]|uniref:Cd(2+)-exporting ATPase n=1 Tax=Granulicatella balaenopterae TaxID=137733 RepID=A0A1H9H0H4_9LACT|nr:heavy metal translocating P-type ATPase [Granulicatella balaenopterae]SEQ55820.1 ATPase, P-type (transporting), HAD superfamily, subfamily IC/heavy metal translocating P-type ATPase [Granulicatella balaenopterae]
MKDYKIIYQSKTRVRVRVSYRLTPDVRFYLDKLKGRFKDIRKIHFYNDSYTMAVEINHANANVVKEFLSAVEVDKVKECYLNPTQEKAITPYDIITKAVYRRMAHRFLTPPPLRLAITLKKTYAFYDDALESLRNKRLDMSVLDFTAIAIALLTGEMKTANTIMFLLNLGTDLDSWSYKKSIEDLEHNLLNQDAEIWIEKNGVRVLVTMNEITIGDHIVISEGNELKYDGVVVSGRAYMNESSLTGETFPISKKAGSKVFANTVVASGELVVEVTNDQANVHLHRLVDLIKESESITNSKQKLFIDKADDLVKYNFIGAAITYLLTGSFTKAISFLLVDYSCALKIATPITCLTAVNEAAEHGIVIKGSNNLEVYHDLTTFVFDKTGTLTTGIPTIERIVPFFGHSVEEVLRIGACLEEHVYHPFAQAVVEKAKQEHIEHEEMHGELQHIASKGIKSTIDGKNVVIGSRRFMKEEGMVLNDEQRAVISETEAFYHLLYLGFEDKVIALFCIDTPLRSDAIDTLQWLKRHGKKIVLLTGDTAERTNTLRQKITFDEVMTEVKPEDKFNYVKNHQESGERVLMIGDGLNDSAALSMADIGVVMDNSSDVARQSCDIILLSDQLHSLKTLTQLSEEMHQQLAKNLNRTVIVNTSLIGLGLFSIFPPNYLAVVHNLTTAGIVGSSFNYLKNKNIK